MTTQETLLAIKKELRAAMNGVVSAKMREAGMPYRLIFGVELPRLSDIAHEFPPDREVAFRLWEENIRECKILATLLIPKQDMTPQKAEEWVEDVPTDEMAQILVMNQLTEKPWAMDVALRWINSEHYMRILCGFLIIARRLTQGPSPDATSAAFIKRRAQACLPQAKTSLRRVLSRIVMPEEELD